MSKQVNNAIREGKFVLPLSIEVKRALELDGNCKLMQLDSHKFVGLYVKVLLLLDRAKKEHDAEIVAVLSHREMLFRMTAAQRGIKLPRESEVKAPRKVA